MTETALRDRPQTSVSSERGADWPLAAVFFASVAGFYGLIAYATYLVVT